MSQLTLYLDEKSLKLIEKCARKDHKSLSGWAKERLLNSINNKWPDEFFSLYGSIKDDSFKRPEQISYDHDSKREAL